MWPVLFGVSEATVRKRVNDGTWSDWRDGRQIRFGPDGVGAIREWGKPKVRRPRMSSLERRQMKDKINAALANYFPET